MSVVRARRRKNREDDDFSCVPGVERDRVVPLGDSATSEWEITVLLIRDIMYCKPGKVRPMADKFLAMAKLSEKKGMGKMRVLTDVSAERYWTVVSEMEVENLEAFSAMMKN